jgi:hypothetical protein
VRESTADVTDATKLGSDHRLWLWDRLLQECELMATYALASGLKVPEAVVQALAVAALQGSSAEAKLTAANGRDLSARNREPRDDVAPQHWLESSIRQLAFAHNRLVDIVAPATPRTILFSQTSTQQAGAWEFLGREPFVRRMMYTAILFLLGVILTRAILHINVLHQGENILPSIGGALFLQLHFMSAAGLGASFAVLFEINTYTLKAAFDPLYEPSYWTRFALGLIAGVMLADLVSVNPNKPLYPVVAQSTLALLGGFSASVVYRILVHLRNTISSLIPTGAGEEADAQPRVAAAMSQEPSAHHRLTVAASLISLQQKLATSMSPEQLKQELDRILADLLAPDVDDQ